MPLASFSLQQLTDAVNDWCEKHHVAPANGQSSDSLSIRTLRYYRTQGLLSAPLGVGRYGNLHRLQILAIRMLQAHGLPLKKIQTLLYGRSEQDLEEVLKRGLADQPAQSELGQIPVQDDWRIRVIDPEVWIILRNGRQLSADQLGRIGFIVHENTDAKSAKNQPQPK